MNIFDVPGVTGGEEREKYDETWIAEVKNLNQGGNGGMHRSFAALRMTELKFTIDDCRLSN
jgi:hypothetical protein